MGEGRLNNGEVGLSHSVSMGVGKMVCGSTNKTCKESIELLNR